MLHFITCMYMPQSAMKLDLHILRTTCSIALHHTVYLSRICIDRLGHRESDIDFWLKSWRGFFYHMKSVCHLKWQNFSHLQMAKIFAIWNWKKNISFKFIDNLRILAYFVNENIRKLRVKHWHRIITFIWCILTEKS